VLLAGAAYVTAAESGPFLTIGETLSDRISGLESGGSAVLSLDSRNLVLDTCTELATSMTGRLMRTAERQRDIGWCADTAAHFAAAAPGYGYAWYVTALMAAEQKDATGLAEGLSRSYATAPTEYWLAERRVALAEAHVEELDPALTAAHDRDLALLVQSRRGIADIARRYVAVPGFRERIGDIVATLPDVDQARFIDTLRGQVAARQAE
jgi:hypothetical protein